MRYAIPILCLLWSAAPAQAASRCKPACDVGHYEFRRYCGNLGLVPYPSRFACFTKAQEVSDQCEDATPDTECFTPCSNLVGKFEEFCQEHSEVKRCWATSVDTFGACRKRARRL